MVTLDNKIPGYEIPKVFFLFRMTDLKISSTDPVTINRLPCAVDPEECGTDVDMTWFDLTRRKMIDDRTGRERVLAQYQGRPLLENKIDTKNLNLVLVKQDGINSRVF